MSVVLNRTGKWGQHNVSTPCTVGIVTKIVLISITSVNAINVQLSREVIGPCQLSLELAMKWGLDGSVKEPKKRLFTSSGVVPWQELEKIFLVSVDLLEASGVLDRDILASHCVL